LPPTSVDDDADGIGEHRLVPYIGKGREILGPRLSCGRTFRSCGKLAKFRGDWPMEVGDLVAKPPKEKKTNISSKT